MRLACGLQLRLSLNDLEVCAPRPAIASTRVGVGMLVADVLDGLTPPPPAPPRAVTVTAAAAQVFGIVCQLVTLLPCGLLFFVDDEARKGRGRGTGDGGGGRGTGDGDGDGGRGTGDGGWGRGREVRGGGTEGWSPEGREAARQGRGRHPPPATAVAVQGQRRGVC
jgi:hypothetical protein